MKGEVLVLLLLRRKHSSSRECCRSLTLHAPSKISHFLHSRNFVNCQATMICRDYVKKRPKYYELETCTIIRCQKTIVCNISRQSQLHLIGIPIFIIINMPVRNHPVLSSLWMNAHCLWCPRAKHPVLHSQPFTPPWLPQLVSPSRTHPAEVAEGTVSSGDCRYDCLTFIQLVLFAAKR